MKRRAWLIFVVIAALTVGIALAIGLVNADRNDPMPRGTLHPGDSIEFQGSRFTLVSFGEVELPDTVDASDHPAGVAYVRIALTQEVVSVPDDNYESFCRMVLITDLGRWDADGSLAYSAGWPTACHQSPESDELLPGTSHEVNAVWVVPPQDLTDARVVVHFASNRTSFEVLP